MNINYIDQGATALDVIRQRCSSIQLQLSPIHVVAMLERLATMDRTYSPIDPFKDRAPSYHSTWDGDVLKDEKVRQQLTRGPWTQRYQMVRQKTIPIVNKVSSISQQGFVPMMKKVRPTKKQIMAFSLLLSLAVAPFASVFGIYDSMASSPFSSKDMSCGPWGITQNSNSTVSGIQGLFVVDFTFGSMPFPLAKLIDIIWDLVVGRGVQMLAWWVSYVVFTDALFRAIERHPAPYRSFTNISLEGPSLASIGTLIADLRKHRSKRTVWLFVFMVISSLYVLSLPTLLSAMTGYVGSSVPYVSLKGSQQMVSVNDFVYSNIILDGSQLGLQNGSCVHIDIINSWDNFCFPRRDTCNCSAPDGQKMSYYQFIQDYPTLSEDQCIFNYTNNTQMFYNAFEAKNESCSANFTIAIDNKVYTLSYLNATKGYCYNNTGYPYAYVQENSICMPDTNHPTYEWGFSTMLSAVVVILQFIWGLAMYAVWLDAQWNSTLVKAGYKMTQLRAALTLSTAAQETLGLELEEMLKVRKNELERNLLSERAEVNFKMFGTELPFAAVEAHEGT